jgi:hypothetical protein
VNCGNVGNSRRMRNGLMRGQRRGAIEGCCVDETPCHLELYDKRGDEASVPAARALQRPAVQSHALLLVDPKDARRAQQASSQLAD